MSLEPNPPRPRTHDTRCAGTSLIIEGGGMRGFYSAGALRCLRAHGFAFPCVIGVSSGALNAAAYVADRLDIDIASLDPSPRSFFNLRGFLHPHEGLVKTDAFIGLFCNGCWEGVHRSATRLLVPAVDASTGELVWWDNADFAPGPEALNDRLVASASIPFVMPRAYVDGRVFADGGIRDSIPLDRAEAEGYRRHVLLLTRPRGYVKGAQHLELYLRWWLRPYPALKRAMLERHVRYNLAARQVERAEDEGRAFVFRMDRGAQVLGRFEYAPAKFEACYRAGYRDAEARLGELETWLASGR